MREDQQTSQVDEGGDSGLSLSYVLGVIRQSRLLILLLVAVVTGLAAVVASMLPNRYDASATVQIDPRRKSISNVEGAVSDLRADSATVDSEVEVVKSKEILVRAIELLNLREDPELTGESPFKRWLQGIGILSRTKEAAKGAKPDNPLSEIVSALSHMSGQPEKDEVAAAFADRLKVQRVRNTTLIEIRFSSADPLKAARIANTIAEVYIKDQIEEKTKASNVAAALLEEKLSDLRHRVGEAEYAVEQFKAQNSIFDAEGHVLSEKNLARILDQTLVAQNSTAEARAKYEQARRVVGRGGNKQDLAEVLQSATIRQRKEELARLTRREAELLTRYGDRHPEMLKIKAEILDANQQLNEEVDRLVANLKNEYEVAQEREQQLAAALSSAKEKQIQTKESIVKLNALQRDAQTSRQLFEALLSRYKQMAEVQDLQLADARIVERAGVPLFPAAPKRKLIVLAALVGSLGMGIVLAFAIDMMAPGVSRAEDVERALDHHHLASLPLVLGSQERLRAVRLMIADPEGIFAETIRGMRHEIDARWHQSAPRVIMVASSLANEGKSAIASNLAHHLALTGVRTLLIDADLRKAALTRVLCPGGVDIGARDCLDDGFSIEDAILRDQPSGLCFLPACGPGPSRFNPSELLASQAMAATIDRLREHFDAIVIDCPPLLPVVDARIVADLADQIVFVMSWRKTAKELARRALRSLGANERKVAGVALNQVDERHLPGLRSYGLGSYNTEPSLDRAA